MRIIICDDCESDAMSAKEVIKRTAQELHVKTEFDIYSNAAEVEHMLLVNKEPADILILDIDMPQISGLELAERLRADNLNLIIIFLSAHEEFVFKAIEFQPFRYIRKIRLETEMPVAIQAAVNVLEISSDKQIILYTEDGEKAVMVSEIMYFEAEKHKTYVYLKNGSCIHARRSIAELHQLINKESFIMIHRSCVVNTDYVKNMQNCLLILKNDEQLLVSRRKFSEVRQQILNIWGEML